MSITFADDFGEGLRKSKPHQPPKGNGALPPEDTAGVVRSPPHAIEAEHGVLGALLLDNTAWARATELLTESDFYRYEHRLIFGTIGRLIQDEGAADIISVFEQLKATGHGEDCDLAYLQALAQSVPSAANLAHHAEIVRERAALRQLITLGDEISTRAYAGVDPGAVHDAAVAALQVIEPSAVAASRKLPLLRLDSLRDASQGQHWLVKHALPAESIVMLFGATGTFKSFIALDAALHVVHGLPWMGRRTQQGAVIYVAAEGGTGLWNRIDAWHRARNLPWQDIPLYVVPVAIDLGTEAWRVVNAVQAASVIPALVVIDTLSQTYSGEENSANEMAAYLRELGQRFRALWRCTVLLVHHVGHVATERPRGSSAITPNVDVLMGAHRDEHEMLATVSNPKMKDGETFADAMFSLGAVELGTDADGDKVTSLVAWHLSTADEINHAMSAEVSAGRGGRDHLFMTLVQNGMKERELRQVFYDEIDEPNLDTRKHAYARARYKAIKAGLIEIVHCRIIDLRAQK